MTNQGAHFKINMRVSASIATLGLSSQFKMLLKGRKEKNTNINVCIEKFWVNVAFC